MRSQDKSFSSQRLLVGSFLKFVELKISFNPQAVAESANTFIALDESIEDFIQEQQNKNICAKVRRDVGRIASFSSRREKQEKF